MCRSAANEVVVQKSALILTLEALAKRRPSVTPTCGAAVSHLHPGWQLGARNILGSQEMLG